MGVILKNLSSDEKVAYLYKPILIVLQEAGGKLDRSEIKSRISDLDEQIAEFAEVVKTSKSTGNTYKEFNFKFNFAIKELSFVEYLSYTKGNPNITLTDKGLNVDIDSLDVKKEIMIPAKKFWNELQENEMEKLQSLQERLLDWVKVLRKLMSNMEPKSVW